MAELLTTREAAERLGVTAGRIRQMIVDGRLPAVKMGRDNFINEDDLKLVEGRKPGRPRKIPDAGSSKRVDKKGGNR